jgi:chromosome segregation ATPase
MLPRVDREERYSTTEAAKILRTTERTVRRRAERGDLEGWRDPTTGRWWASARSVHKAMSDRPPKASEEPSESPQSVPDLLESIRTLERQLGRRQLGRLEGQRELEEVTQSTLREQLERERERADRLEEELREARQAAARPWWRKVFGG